MSAPKSGDLPNLILTGFMGTGKSSLGRILAERWRRPFLDTDHLIEQREKMPVSRIFAERGEAAFRALERRCVEEWLPLHGAVIACGGGLVVPEGMVDLLRSRGIVVCLFASPETVLRRTAHSTHRPLLRDAPDPIERIRQLQAERERAYLRAGASIFTDGRNFQDLASAIERIYFRAVAPPKRVAGVGAGRTAVRAGHRGR